MAQEEQIQRYSNSSSGGCGGGGDGGTAGGGGGGCSSSRSSKKLKQKKVPQRGLGVAQLEKIRLEEQQKKDAVLQSATILSPNSIISPSNSCSSLAVQCTSFRPNPSPSIPPASPTGLPSPNSIFRSPPLIPNIDIMRPNSVPNNVGGSEMGWQAIPSSGSGNWSKLWNSEYNPEGENHKLDHHGSFIRSNVNLPYESNTPIWPLPGIMQRSLQFQEPCPSSMVNVPSGTSSSSLMNFRIEPPSNQSYRGNNYTPLWPEEERMVGMKRSYPFSIDDAPVPSFNCRFPPAYVSTIPRIDESASFSNDGTFNIEPVNTIFREGPSSSSGLSELNKKKLIKENGGFNGDFLTLAPPKPKHTSSYLSLHSQEIPDFDALPYQGTTDDPVHWPGPSRSIQQPFFSFLPSANTKNGQSAGTISNSNGEVVESVDLNLKL